VRRLAPFAILLLAAMGCRQAVRTSHDVIYLLNGEEKIGALERITTDSLWFATEEGTLAFAKSEVRGLDLPQPRQGEEWKTVKDIDDPLLRKLFTNLTLPKTDARYVNLYVEHNFILHEDGTFEKRMRVIRYVSAESGKGAAANNTWSYLADRAYAKVDFARSYSPEGVVSHITESAINRVSRYPAPAEYSNLTQLQIAVPESRVGSVLDFQFSTIQNVADSIHPICEEIVLEDRQPTLMEIIRLEQPQGGPLAVYASSGQKPERETRKGREILTWRIQNQPPLRFEQMTPPAADYLPHFIVAEEKDWHSIARSLRAHADKAIQPGERLTQVVDSLTQGLPTSEEKARALYEFVAASIRPAGPSLDSYSYVPTPAETVLVRGFANNLDRAALLCVLMREAGLEADLVLIRDRSSGQLVPSFPTLGQLNTALVLFEDRIYLDPSPNAGFGILSEQDAMGLSLSSGKLKKTPLRTPNEEATITRTVAQLRADGSLNLTVDVEFNGQNSAWWKRYLKPLSPAELRQEAEELASYIHPNARLQDFSFNGIEPLDKEVSYTLKIGITDYATRAGDYLILYLPGVEHSAYWVGARDRAYPIDRVTRSADILNLSLQLPPGAELIYYPQDVSISNPYDSYAATFVQPGRGRLQFSESLQVLKPWIPSQEYPKYKELVEGMARLSQEPIVLKLR